MRCERPNLVYHNEGLEVWRFEVESGPASNRSFLELLSPDELARSASIRHAPTRDRFIIRRATLRQLLGTRLGIAPNTLEFEIAPGGKPHLVGQTLSFSVSSSNGIGLVAVDESQDVGVDIQWHDPKAFDPDFVFLTPTELNRIQSLDLPIAQSEFFQIWTRKEAWVKALGVGLNYDLHSLEMIDPSNVASTRLSFRDGHVQDITMPAGYSAAVAWRNLH